jgi:hypothetical protein
VNEVQTEQQVTSPRYGGWQVVATHLTEAGYPTSRQLVYGWWRNRSSNEFPNGIKVNGKVKLPIADVIQWRANYVPDRGGRPRKGRRVDHE